MPAVIRVPALRAAMATAGQLNRSQFHAALAWGTPPNISIVPALGACGEFTPTPGNNTIRIDQRLFVDFEAGRGKVLVRARNVYVLGVTLLHEMAHWGDNLDGIDRAGEEGNEFERLVYGAVVPC